MSSLQHPRRTLPSWLCVAVTGTRAVLGSVVVWPGRRAVLPPLQCSMPARAASVTWYSTLLYPGCSTALLQVSPATAACACLCLTAFSALLTCSSSDFNSTKENCGSAE